MKPFWVTLSGPSERLDTIASKIAEAQAPTEAFMKPMEGAKGCELQPGHPTPSALTATAAGPPSSQLLTLCKQFAWRRQVVWCRVLQPWCRWSLAWKTPVIHSSSNFMMICLMSSVILRTLHKWADLTSQQLLYYANSADGVPGQQR